MEELKEGWRRVKLGEVADILSGYAFKANDFKETGIPVIKIKNITPPKVSLEDTQFVSEDLYNEKIKYGLSFDDIVISMTGSHASQPNSVVGRVARIKEKNVKILLNQRVGKIYPRNEECNQSFLYYYLAQDFIKFELAASAGGSASQANINPNQIKELEMNFPPLETQQKIASILSSFDDKIELNNEMNKTLEEMAQTLFKRWFIDFEFPNENGEPYRSSGGKMVESELGEIPEGWRVGVLEEVIEKIVDNRGKTPPRAEEGIPLIEGNNIFLDEINPILSPKQKYVSKETYNSWFRAGHPEYLDILCATVGTLPKWCFMPANTNLCIAQNIIAIRSNELISPYYLKMYIDTENFIKRFNGRIVTTAQPSIKVGHLTSLPITIPNVSIIKNFDNIMKNIFRRNEEILKENKSLILLRDTLLPKLINGEVEI